MDTAISTMWKILLVVATTLVVNTGATENNNRWFPSSKSGNYFGWSGHWGGWGDIQYCPEDSKAVGFWLQTGGFSENYETVQKKTLVMDYVGANSMCLICERGKYVCSRKGSTTSPLKNEKFIGKWYSSVKKMGKNCNDGFTEAGFKWLGRQGSSDDKAGTEVALVCGVTPKGGEREWFYSGCPRSYPLGQGAWLTYKKCPKGTRICGLQTLVEGWKYNEDVTGLNGVWFTCCATIGEVHGDGRVDFTDGSYCERYSEKACEGAIRQNGLIKGGKGSAFAGNYPTKGCYAYTSGKYEGRGYYGTGGSESQMKATPSIAHQYRPDGYEDCQYFTKSPAK